MKRKVLALSAIVVLAATLFTAADSGVAGAAPPAATGSVGCKITGSGRFSPTLTLAGSATTDTTVFTASGACSASATIPGTTIVPSITAVSIVAKGTFKKVGAGFANKCSAVQLSDRIGVIKVTYNWTSVPAIAPTVVTFTGGTASLFSPYTATLDKIRLPDPSGTTKVTTGSFAPAVAPVVLLDTNILRTCTATWSYAAFTIKPGSFITLP